MKFCYVDESGNGSEPYLIMVGVVVDALRMQPTKQAWNELLDMLSRICKKTIPEFHTRDFYAGNGPWRGIDGPMRARIIDAVLNWWSKRKHMIVFSAIDKSIFEKLKSQGKLLPDCESAWHAAAVHLILSIQKSHQAIKKNKGNALLLFDRELSEEAQLTKFVFNPPPWTDEFYDRSKKQIVLDQIIDVPFFGDSQEVVLLQVADLIAYILRRYAEIHDAKVPPTYHDEPNRLETWVKFIEKRSYPSSSRWPKRGANSIHEFFNILVPPSLRGIN